MPTTTRSRTLPGIRRYGGYGYSDPIPLGSPKPGYPIGWSDEGSILSGKQVTVSENHGPKASLGGSADTGGPFSTWKTWVSKQPPYTEIEWWLPLNYNGSIGRWNKIAAPWFPNPHAIWGYIPQEEVYPEKKWSSHSDINGYGTTAISRCVPTNPLASLSVSLGEASREGLPSLPLLKSLEKRASIVKNAGSEFLNAAFGWAPLVRDVQSVSQAVVDRQKLLAQYERDSGRMIRRRYRFPVEERTNPWGTWTFDVLPNGNPSFIPILGSQVPTGANVSVSDSYRIERWFSGAFTYYLPRNLGGRNAKKVAAQASKLLGLEITPDLVWNIAPWTWAIDWVSNAGDVVNNVTRFQQNGLVLRYGYLMEHTVSSINFEWDMIVKSSQIPSGSMSYTTETKTRTVADPYGFDVSYEGLSTFQKSVIAALGISRSRR